MNQPTTRVYRKGGSRQWYVAEGEAGAITFFTDRWSRRGPLRPGDLGYHEAADGPQLRDFDDIDPFWTSPCEFTKTAGCRYSGFTSEGMLDILTNEGEAALLARLSDIYVKHFNEEAN